MTAGDFAKWVNNTLLPKARDYHPEMATSITPRTARNWLHNLGFEPRSSKKGVYIDGHERTDVVEYILEGWKLFPFAMHHHLYVLMRFQILAWDLSVKM